MVKGYICGGLSVYSVVEQRDTSYPMSQKHTYFAGSGRILGVLPLQSNYRVTMYGESKHSSLSYWHLVSYACPFLTHFLECEESSILLGLKYDCIRNKSV